MKVKMKCSENVERVNNTDDNYLLTKVNKERKEDKY